MSFLPEGLEVSISRNSSSFLILDSAENEQRVPKRTLSISPPLLRRKVEVPTSESALDIHPAVKAKANVETGSPQSALHSVIVSEPTFLDATVKKTWAYGYERHEDIMIEEVLQREDLTSAVISSYQWDLDWLHSKINIDSTELMLIVGAKGESSKRQCEEQGSRMSSRLRLCFVPMEDPVQIMHSKLMLLFHPTHLRIVVTTANLMPYDWGETGVMENMVFLIDLPQIPAAARKSREQMSSFEKSLVTYLDAMGLDEEIGHKRIIGFDFSRTKDLAFVHSIGGVHIGEDEPWRRTGFCALGSAVQELGLEVVDGSAVAVDYVTSSLGSLRWDFLQTVYMACQGDDGWTKYGWQHNITKSGKKLERWTKVEAERLVSNNMSTNLRIYFPFDETVENSRGGTASGGTICFNGNFKSYPHQVRDTMRDCRSQRPGLLMHNKLIFVRRLGHLKGPSPGWVYVGSANCSQSAWGAMTKDKKLGLPKLTCRNWECGVVIPVRMIPTTRIAGSIPEGGNEKINNSESTGMKIFDTIIPVPMQIPGAHYMGQNPWGARESKVR